MIQVGAFYFRYNAMKTLAKASKDFPKPVLVFFEKGLNKVRITGFRNYGEAKSYLPEVVGKGYLDAFIVRTPAGK